MFAKAAATASFAVLALGTLAAPPAAAQIYVQVAPPPPRVEAVPAPRRNQVWVPGHWEWRNNRHVWVRGEFVRERRGYAYNQPQWVDRDGRWEYRRGGWDRDGDGVRNRNDRDRDGDGVRNRNDRQPNNPYRN